MVEPVGDVGERVGGRTGTAAGGVVRDQSGANWGVLDQVYALALSAADLLALAVIRSTTVVVGLISVHYVLLQGVKQNKPLSA